MADRITRPPPQRPSTKRFIKAGADPRKVDEAQDIIQTELKRGVLTLIHGVFDEIRVLLDETERRVAGRVERYFDGSREVIRGSLLRAGLDHYYDGKAHGRTESTRLFHAYQSILDEKYAAQLRDPRVEAVRPEVTLEELRAVISSKGFELSAEELKSAAADLEIPLAPPNLG